jgi:hypothetical protein
VSTLATLAGPWATTLVTSPRTVEVLTATRECGAMVALRRGLAEYLVQAPQANAVGRDLSLVGGVAYSTADWEQVEKLPAGSVEQDGEAAINYPSLTPELAGQVVLDEGTRAALYLIGEVRATLTVTLTCRDVVARGVLSDWLEQTLFPVDWLAGFRLHAGFYHGATLRYSPVGVVYGDEVDDVRERRRLLSVRVDAVGPILRLSTAGPPARPVVNVRAVGVDVSLTPEVV